MEAFIVIIYLIIFIWLILKINFFKKSGLTRFWLTTFFLIKVTAGILYGIFHTTIPHYAVAADTWRFFYESKLQTNLLLNNPVRFFLELTDNPYDKNYRHFFSNQNSFWNDLREIFMIKLVAVMNIFSGHRYYVNVVIFSFLTYFGPVAFIRVMKDIFKGKLAIIAGTTFMIPSFIFWTSGIHKDGIVFLVIGLTTYHLYNYFKNKQSKKSLLYITLLLIGLFPLRNYVVLAMIPAIFAWWWSTKMNSNKWLPFVLTGIACISILFTTKYIFPKINLPVAIVMKQNSFRALGGESILPQPSLSSDIRSFIKNAPNALNHALARPYLNEADSIAVFLSALEIILFWLFVFIWFFRYSDNPYRHPTIMFLLMISISVLLLTGYIVPQMGAIVRYRSIFLPLIIIPVMCTTKWRKTY